jgi:dihydrolipoamide dehydrogenase
VRILDVARSQETAILQSPAVIVATGSRPAGLPGIERNGTTVLDSADALNLEDAPKELLILGGGYVGCEFACVFSALGSRVTLLEAQSRLLPGMDRELGQALERALRRAGLTLLLNTQARSVESGNSVRVLLTDGQVLAGDKLLVSIGRIPCSDGLGLEAAGVQLDGRAIRVNDFLETNVPGIYAVGDVTGKCPLAHVASAQARFVVDRILARNQRPDSPPSADSEDDKRFVTHGGHEPGPLEGRAPARPAPGQSLPQASQGLRPPEIGRQSMESEGKPDRPFSYRAIPACVFTYPEIASVGLTEADAAAAGMTVRVSRFPFAASGKALAAGDSEGFVKLVADAKTGQLLGGQIMGTHASELIGQVTLAVQNQLTAAAMVDTIAAHPTLSEAIHETAEGLFGQSIHIFSRPATPLG